ncbi:MAG: ProQ/FINO family protein [Rhodoferax sp.]|nr:ProQ/FINO family protein [Rhodoferax sp.]
MLDTPTESLEENVPTETVSVASKEPAKPSGKAKSRTKPSSKMDVYPVLEQLAALYPPLFGSVFLPLKRGIFQDLLAAHPDAFDKEGLKAALAFHTRSTRYLSAVASGQQRHDLQGDAVEAMAPEHVHHALLEVFRRRQMRTEESLQPKLVQRIVQAFEASGLSAQAYVELVRSRDLSANALLEEALVQAQTRSAKNEALLRAFEASGKTVESFAEMYGMNPREVEPMLARARTTSQPA